MGSLVSLDVSSKCFSLLPGFLACGAFFFWLQRSERKAGKNTVVPTFLAASSFAGAACTIAVAFLIADIEQHGIYLPVLASMLPLEALLVLIFACRLRPYWLTFTVMGITLLGTALSAALAVLIIAQDYESQYIGMAEGLNTFSTVTFLGLFVAIPIDMARFRRFMH